MKSYLISDPKYYTNNPIIFKQTLEKSLSTNNVDFVCFRDKTSNNIDELVNIFINVSKKYKITNTFINSQIDLAIKYNAYGIHLTSKQFDKIEYCKKLGLKVIISCHNEIEIEIAISKKVDFITYSPIFNTPNKGQVKGIDNLSFIASKYNCIDIFALGGIVSQNHINLINDTGVYGFASIRYFNNNV